MSERYVVQLPVSPAVADVAGAPAGQIEHYVRMIGVPQSVTGFSPIALSGSSEVEDIQRGNLAALVGKPLLIIEERDGEFIVHQHTADSVSPQTSYPTKRDAAARVLQLLHVGPVRPQMHPERVQIDLPDLSAS